MTIFDKILDSNKINKDYIFQNEEDIKQYIKILYTLKKLKATF